jgi:hypothetical protein
MTGPSRPRRHRWQPDLSGLADRWTCERCGLERRDVPAKYIMRDGERERVWHHAPPCPPPADDASRQDAP